MSQIGQKLRRWRVSLKLTGTEQTIGRSLVATNLNGKDGQQIVGPLKSNFPSGPFCFPAYMLVDGKAPKGGKRKQK